MIACSSDELIEVSIVDIYDLPIEVNECSGLAFDGENIHTVNDSGDGPIIYTIDPLNGQLLDQHLISGAVNIDWEAIEYDGSGFWIGDIGNNSGNRTDTKLYKLNDNFEILDTVDVFFPNKSVVGPGEPHNYDIEAFNFCQDRIFFFSKNRANTKTDIQLFDVMTSESLILKKSIDVPGFITDATKIPERDMIILLSQKILDNTFDNFLVVLKIKDGCDFEKINEIKIPISDQAEGICYVGNDMIFIGSEDEAGLNTQKIYQLELSF